MGQPLFLLQIVDTQTGEVAQLPMGGKLEADLIASCVAEAIKRKVGFFRTEAHVRDAIEKGFTSALHLLKRETRRLV